MSGAGSDGDAPAIVVDGVRKTYGSGRSAVDALRGVDLEVEAGELLAVLGPSGSGKTTLLNVVGGIDTPTDGEVVVRGRSLRGADAAALAAYRRRSVGFVFQFFNLIPSLTALENVQIIAELTGGDAARASAYLERVGLGERQDHFPSSLSGGEAQRVGIARALAKEPELLLCDEPTGALDLDTGRDVLGALRRANREDGVTTILVTHNAAVAEMADRVVRMRSGEVVEIERNEAPVEPAEVTW